MGGLALPCLPMFKACDPAAAEKSLVDGNFRPCSENWIGNSKGHRSKHLDEDPK